MNINSASGAILFKDVPVLSSADITDEYMSSCKAHLQWSSSKYVAFGIGTYIEVSSQRYYLYSSYEPSQTTERKYNYDVYFFSPRSYVNFVPLTFTTRDSTGTAIILTDWSVTDVAKSVFLYITEAIKKAYGFDVSLSIIGEVNASATCSFTNMSIGEGITEACSKFNCECFFDYDSHILYVGSNLQLNAGVTADLIVGKNIGAPTISKNSDQSYNNFVVRGGTKNMSSVSASGENVATNTRLTLDPEKYQNSEIFIGQNDEPKVTKILIYDDVFPHAEFYVYNVRGWERYLLDDDKKKVPSSYNEDGTVKAYKTYTIWFMRLATPVKDANGNVTAWNDLTIEDNMVIDGKTLSCSFVANAAGSHSSLSGRSFELHFHKTAETEGSSDSVSGTTFSVLAGDFEIVYTNENDLIIPTTADGGLYPYGTATPTLEADTVQIYNITMPAAYKKQAYQDLEIAAFIDIHKIQRDFGSLESKVYPSAFKGDTPLVLKVGNSVMVYNAEKSRSYNTRITKIVRNLNKPNVVTVTVSNDVTLGSKSEISSSVSTLKNQISSIVSGSNENATNADLVRKIIDVYGGRKFLSKNSIDTAAKLINFLEGINVKGTSTMEGIEILNKIAGNVVKVIYSRDFNEDSTGFGIYRDSDGNYHLDIDFVNIRKKLSAKEVEIHEETYIGGTAWLTVGGGLVISDVKAGILDFDGTTHNGFYCYYNTKDPDTGETIHNLFDDYDQALCQTFNLTRGRDGKLSNRYYWRLLLTTSTAEYDKSNDEGWVFLANDTVGVDYISGSDTPLAGDKIVHVGNRKNKDRQGAIRLSAVGTSIEEFVGINSFTLPYPLQKMKPGDNHFTGTFVTESGTNINDAITDVSNRIHIFYGYGIPTLTNKPAVDWTENEYSSHDQDIYFDINREPASYGGRAYKFMADATTGKWGWVNVDDADTISALNLASDMANDGKITGGAEKSRLLVEWLKAQDDVVRYSEQAEDYGFPNDDTIVAGTDTFKSIYQNLMGDSGAWKALCTYLNSNTTLATGSTPDWISDEMLQKTTVVDAATYRKKWNDYYNAMALMLKAITYKAKLLSDAAQKTADEALSKISDIAKDGKLTSSEKVTIKREFIACYNEKNKEGGLIDKASAATSQYWNIDGAQEYMSDAVKTSCQEYIKKFRNLGHYLNGDKVSGDTWAANATVEHNGAEAWTEKTTIADADLPAWLQSANMQYTTDIVASDFQGYWNDFYTARTNLMTTLTDNALDTATKAQTDADAAQKTADAISSDSILSGGWEKMDIYIEWMKCKSECAKYSEQATDLSVDHSAYGTAFQAVGDLLNGKWDENGSAVSSYTSVDWNSSTTLPSWIDSANLGKDTKINAGKFKEVWTAYSDALSLLLKNIGTALNKRSTTQVSTSATIPAAPYKKGDFWRKPTTLVNPYTGDTYSTDSDGNQLYDLYVCINDCNIVGSEKQSDWQIQDQASRYYVSNTAKGLYDVMYGSDRKSGIVTTLNSVTNFVDNWKTDDSGNLLYKTSAVVLQDNYASMFTKMCANDGSVLSDAGIATFVTSTDGNKYISGVKIYGDDISLSASHKLTISGDYIVINTSNFTIDEDGNVGILGKITATSGVIGGNTQYNYSTGKTEVIGGFSISGSGLTYIVPKDSMEKDNMGYIICRNDYYGRFAGIGANVLPLPSASGIAAVARFENEDTNGWYGDCNIAMLLSAKNAMYNFAFCGIGNGFLNGNIEGFVYQEIAVVKDKITSTDYSKGSKILFTNSVSNGGIALPTIQNIRSSLGISSSTKFSIMIQFVQVGGTTTENVIFGKNASVYSMGTNNVKTYWMNNDNYPQIYNDNRGTEDSISMGPGDCLMLMIVYNGSEYCAYWVNKNW